MVRQRSDLHLTGEEPTLCLDGSRDGWLTQASVSQEPTRQFDAKAGDNTVYHTGSTSERFDGEIVRA